MTQKIKTNKIKTLELMHFKKKEVFNEIKENQIIVHSLMQFMHGIEVFFTNDTESVAAVKW